MTWKSTGQAGKKSWFERITGFPETDYAATQALLRVVDGRLESARSPLGWEIGAFELPSLSELRVRVAALGGSSKKTSFTVVCGDVAELHCRPENGQALFQVASQFNALEMPGPSTTPEDGVTDYARDHTQGPACAIAAGAATIWRNYLVPVGGQTGQTANLQIDTLTELGAALGNSQGRLWHMRNGYALCSADGLEAIGKRISVCDATERSDLAGLLRVAVHWDAAVTAADQPQVVSQVFCSALPCAYTDLPLRLWEPFARLVLDAAYEATLLLAKLNLHRTGCPIVFLTRLGGGAFGNADEWIDTAMRRALDLGDDLGLDIRLVRYGK